MLIAELLNFMMAGNDGSDPENQPFFGLPRASRNRLSKAPPNAPRSSPSNNSPSDTELDGKTLCDEDLNSEDDSDVLGGDKLSHFRNRGRLLITGV